MNKPSISLQTTIADLFSLFPHHREELLTALTNAGLHCGGCAGAQFENLGEGLAAHGMSEEEMNELVSQLNEIVSSSPQLTITLTAIAAEKFNEIAKEEGKEGWALRFGVIPSSCHSFEYLLGFSEKPLDDDQVFESSGIQIHVNRQMVGSVLGSRIDYVDEDACGGGFAIANPNRRSGGCCGGGGGGSCGCSH